MTFLQGNEMSGQWEGWEGYLRKWRRGRTSLRDLLLRNCKKMEAERALICRTFPEMRPYAVNGDAVEVARNPSCPRKPPDIYLFQSEESPPLCVIECKYDVQANPRKGARSWRAACGVVAKTTEKFETARAFLAEEGLGRLGRDWVVMSQETAQLLRFHWEGYLAEQELSGSTAHAQIRVVDTSALRDELLRFHVELYEN